MVPHFDHGDVHVRDFMTALSAHIVECEKKSKLLLCLAPIPNAYRTFHRQQHKMHKFLLRARQKGLLNRKSGAKKNNYIASNQKRNQKITKNDNNNNKKKHPLIFVDDIRRTAQHRKMGKN